MSYSFNYRGARAMTMMHEQQMRSCLEVWKKAKAADITLPETEDKDYQSLEHVLYHIFRAARGYMTWMCEKLELPDPDIRQAPDLDSIESQADDYLDHLLTQWAKPLVDIEEERFNEVYKSRWNVEYCIDAMMEHAVLHPMRHQFQLEELMKQQK